MKNILLNREGYRCIYCDDPVTYSSMEADHVVLYGHGGPYTEENLVCACSPCNNARGWLPAEVFMMMMLNALAGVTPPEWAEEDEGVPRRATG